MKIQRFAALLLGVSILLSSIVGPSFAATETPPPDATAQPTPARFQELTQPALTPPAAPTETPAVTEEPPAATPVEPVETATPTPVEPVETATPTPVEPVETGSPPITATATLESPTPAAPDASGLDGLDQQNGADAVSRRKAYLPLISRSTYSSGGGSGAPAPAGKADGWPMAGANLWRTSWTPESVPGSLKPVWFKHLDAYISQKVQIIASNNTLFISTAQGLIALDAETGKERWTYPTSMPLGHSPTIYDNVAYVGGFDGKIHAVNALNGQPLWTFQGGAGFETNPLIAEGKLFAGNRDGHLYAIAVEGANTGQLVWKFKTGGPVLYSAAYADGVLYFASNDSYAYAVRAGDGQQVWKSAKLPGRGFHSWWPVVYKDHVVFSGSYNYRYLDPLPGPHTDMERDQAYPAGSSQGAPIGPKGTEPGDWIKGTSTINASASAQYFEKNPQRRTYFVLNRGSGKEFTFDADKDGKPEYAPILWFGTHSGNRFPPAVGSDGVLYQANNLYYDQWIPRGRISGWKFGTPFVSAPSGSSGAVDEPVAYAIGGNIVYWKRCCDRMAGAFEVTRPSGSASDLQSWTYYDEGGKLLRRTLPDLFKKGWNFAYWKHGDQSPPIPYRGRVYIIANNAIVAFAPNGINPVIGEENRGQQTGEKAGDIQRSQTITGLNTKVTLSNNAWPLLIQQESYYATDTSTSATARWFRMAEVAGSGGQPSNLNVQDKGVSTLLTSTFDGGKTLKTWVSGRSPATLFQNSGSTYLIKGKFAGLAYPASGGVKIKTGQASFGGSELGGGWLLAWENTGEHRWSPLVISLQRRPSQVSYTASGIELKFSGEAGFMAVTPLYGMSAPKSGEASAWPGGIPGETIQRAQLLDRVARAFPETGSTEFSVNNSSGDVTYSYAYTYVEFANEWGSPPLRVAYLPPNMGLAAWKGSPVRINDKPLEQLLDLNWVTPLGRVAGVADSSSARVHLPGLARYWNSPAAPRGGFNGGDHVNARLVDEVRKMVAAGHLLPAYGMVGIWEGKTRARSGDYLADYWKNPADTTYTLLQALPWLPGDVQAQVRSYLQKEFQSYPLYNTAHMGWKNGASRHAFDIPPDVIAKGAELGPSSTAEFNRWGLPPHNFYALWMYAREFGDAKGLFDKAKSKLDTKPRFEASTPYVLNSYIAGYTGYLRLASLAGAGAQPAYERTLADLLVLRLALSKFPAALQGTGFEYGGYQWAVRRFAPNQTDTLFNATVAGSLWSQMPLYGFPMDPIYGLSGAPTGGDYAFAIDFVNLTPELGSLLRDYAPNETAAAVDSYTKRAPHWFVANAEEAGGEGVFQPLYDRAAYFQARALALRQGRGELEKWLDIPAVAVGDLFYMQNLVFTLQAP